MSERTSTVGDDTIQTNNQLIFLFPHRVRVYASIFMLSTSKDSTIVGLIEFYLFWVGVAEAVLLTFLFETWKVGSLSEEVRVGTL